MNGQEKKFSIENFIKSINEGGSLPRTGVYTHTYSLLNWINKSDKRLHKILLDTKHVPLQKGC